MATYTMTLQEALEIDPTIFDFEYSPLVIINESDLKDWIKMKFMLREIGQETIENFRFYLERRFLLKATWLKAKLDEYVKMSSMDQMVTAKVKANGTSKTFLTPISIVAEPLLDSTRQTVEQETDNVGGLPAVIYSLYSENYVNIIDEFLEYFEDLFMGVY